MSIEQKIFTWTGWDEVGDFTLYFYNAVLLVPIGDFPVGRKFDGCMIDATGSRIVFQEYINDNIVEYAFELSYSVGKRLD